MERIDKILSNAGLMSRRDAKEAAKKHRITVNGTAVKSADEKINDDDILELDGNPVNRQKFYYIMMNKPAGCICSTDDPTAPTVMSRIDEADLRRGMFPVGRLDKYTVGLLIISNDGILAHDLLSPKKHVPKRYFFRLEKPYDSRFTKEIEKGIKLDGDATAKPASLEMTSPCEGYITVTEGMFHLVKRIFEATGNKVTYLKRTDFGPLSLDSSLPEGRYRFLTDAEAKSLILAQKG